MRRTKEILKFVFYFFFISSSPSKPLHIAKYRINMIVYGDEKVKSKNKCSSSNFSFVKYNLKGKNYIRSTSLAIINQSLEYPDNFSKEGDVF